MLILSIKDPFQILLLIFNQLIISTISFFRPKHHLKIDAFSLKNSPLLQKFMIFHKISINLIIKVQKKKDKNCYKKIKLKNNNNKNIKSILKKVKKYHNYN